MRYADLSKTMRGFLGVWEGMRKLGFSADEIFCNISPSSKLGGKPACFAQLVSQEKEFFVECGPVTDAAAFHAEYLSVVDAIASGAFPQADLDRIWQESACCQHPIVFTMALASKGFRIPKDLLRTLLSN